MNNPVKQEYPKMVYKSREDYKQVDSIDEEEAAAEDGYGAYAITVLGRKPGEEAKPIVPVKGVKHVFTEEELEEFKNKIVEDFKKEIIEALRSEIKADLEDQYKAKFEEEVKAFKKSEAEKAKKSKGNQKPSTNKSNSKQKSSEKLAD